MKLNKLMTALALAGLACSGTAMATDGMFAAGYGMTANGMGGAATAMTEDTFGGANNPASMAFVGDRIDLGGSLFSPHRQASINSPYPGYSGSENSDANYFIIPEFGYNHMLNNDLALGVSVYGNGGMNSDYGTSTPQISGAMGGSGNLGVNLIQLIVAPTLAYKVTENNSIGIAPLFAYQQFTAQGFGAPSNGSTESATGTGVRVGYTGKITPDLTIGAQYASKIIMGAFNGYGNNVLVASQGSLDLAENYSLGVAYQTTKALKLALDFQRINYADVPGIGTSPTLRGFGWQDINVWKLGAEYKYNDQWTLRAGWNHTDNPIPASAVYGNIVAPGVIEDHITFGASYFTPTGNEWTVAYIHAFQNSLTGPSPTPPNGPGGTTTISMYEDTLGVAYAWK
ncbi:MAG: outer membrane protein transport protein [Betaproteobacteria bacterium]|nr:outer membrane protein transport protein [Betaproteobacteria bacterium]